jgi:hypothetical protein
VEKTPQPLIPCSRCLFQTIESLDQLVHMFGPFRMFKSGSCYTKTSSLIFPLKKVLFTSIWYNLTLWEQVYGKRILTASTVATGAYVPIKFQCKCKQSYVTHISKCNNHVHELAPPTFVLLQILITFYSSTLLLWYSLIYLSSISLGQFLPPLSLITTKVYNYWDTAWNLRVHTTLWWRWSLIVEDHSKSS